MSDFKNQNLVYSSYGITVTLTDLHLRPAHATLCEKLHLRTPKPIFTELDTSNNGSL